MSGSFCNCFLPHLRKKKIKSNLGTLAFIIFIKYLPVAADHQKYGVSTSSFSTSLLINCKES